MSIVDASVIIKWFIPEINQNEAEQLKLAHLNKAITLCIPPNAILEITNTLAVSKKLATAHIELFLDILGQMKLREEKFNLEDYKKIANIANVYAISCYDAAYVHLAKRLNTQLITADQKLFTKTKTSGLVKLL